MKIVVTGASGFVGSAASAALRTAAHQPAALDLRGADALRAVDGADAIVHLAAIAHRHASEEELRRVNVELAVRVARAAVDAGARLLFLSSVKVHGEATTHPLRESAAFQPRDAYARSKATAEERLRAMPGLKLTVLRPPLVYGAGVRANFLALMKAVNLGVPLPFANVVNRRSLVYLGNLTSAIVRCVEAAQAVGRTFFVSDGTPVSTPLLCRALGDALGRPARLFGFPPALLPLGKLTGSLEIDDTAIRRELDWRPPFSFDEGLRATARWYRGR